MATQLQHLIRFDFRAHRHLLALFAGALVVQTAVLIVGPGPLTGPDTRLSWDIGLLIIRCGLMMAVAAQFVQSDCLVGTQAFWMTRPIRRWTLLVSKLLPAIAWLVVLPAVFMGVTLLALGLSTGDALAGAGVTAFEQSILLAMIFMAAVVTANLAQLIVAGIAGVTSVALLNGVVLPAITLTWPAIGDELGGWQPAVYGAVVLLGATGTVVHQYVTLRAWHSLAIVALTMVLATVATSASMLLAANVVKLVPGISGGQAPQDSSDATLAGATLQWAGRGQAPFIDAVMRTLDLRREAVRRLSFGVAVSGAPADLAFWPVSVRTELRASGSSAIQWEGSVSQRPSVEPRADNIEEAPFPSLRRVLGDVKLLAQLPGTSLLTPVAEMTSDEYARCQSASGVSLTSDITYDVYRYRITASAPLVAGASLHVAGRVLSIASIESREPRNSGVRINARETQIGESLVRYASASPITGYFVIRNTAGKQAVLVTWVPARVFRMTFGMASTSIQTARSVLDMVVPGPVSSQPRIDDDWLRGAELLLIEPLKVGQVTRPVHIDTLKLPALGR